MSQPRVVSSRLRLAGILRDAAHTQQHAAAVWRISTAVQPTTARHFLAKVDCRANRPGRSPCRNPNHAPRPIDTSRSCVLFVWIGIVLFVALRHISGLLTEHDYTGAPWWIIRFVTLCCWLPWFVIAPFVALIVATLPHQTRSMAGARWRSTHWRCSASRWHTVSSSGLFLSLPRPHERRDGDLPALAARGTHPVRRQPDAVRYADLCSAGREPEYRQLLSDRPPSRARCPATPRDTGRAAAPDAAHADQPALSVQLAQCGGGAGPEERARARRWR